MAPRDEQSSNFGIQNLESYNRIINIPVINRGWFYAEDAYGKIKKLNHFVGWTLDQAENSVKAVAHSASPAVVLFEKPISGLDKIICKSLDIAEERVPSIYLPPERIYSNTKQYINEVVVEPVLKRADSVKQLGATVLTSKYTEYAADKLDGALHLADAYVDKYLPAERYDDQNETSNNAEENNSGKAIHTIQHADKLSRKLKRRLTKRTFEEAKILKEHSAEAVHVLVYIGELVVTDPKLAFQKGKELWGSLSKDEPENQARPQNLEELIVLLIRETSRRVVHFVNYATSLLIKVPEQAVTTASKTGHTILIVADQLIKTVHLDGVQQIVFKVIANQAQNLTFVLKQLNSYATSILEELAQKLEDKSEQKGALTVPPVDVQPKAANRKAANSNSSNNKRTNNNKNSPVSNGNVEHNNTQDSAQQ